MSVVAPAAVTEAGTPPQKDGEKHPSSSYVTISSPLEVDYRVYYFKEILKNVGVFETVLKKIFMYFITEEL